MVGHETRRPTACEKPVEERIAVAETIMRSLNAPDSEHDTEWAAVANRRLSDIREGRVDIGCAYP